MGATRYLKGLNVALRKRRGFNPPALFLNINSSGFYFILAKEEL
jgi:hypothetical protein